MLQTTGHLHQYLPLAAASIVVAEVANTEKVTAAIDMSKFRKAMFILQTGDIAAQTLDFQVESDSSSGFATAKATLKSATQVAPHASNNDSKQVIIEVDASQLPDGHRYVRGRAIGGGAITGPVAITVLGATYASGQQSASVVETK